MLFFRRQATTRPAAPAPPPEPPPVDASFDGDCSALYDAPDPAHVAPKEPEGRVRFLHGVAPPLDDEDTEAISAWFEAV